jgi:hypothetical protein
MSDISNQLIKDSYNYVLQSDLSSGGVYRIGGTVPVNPKFLSGLTVMEKFVYSDGTEQFGYALLTDGTGLAFWGPVSAATPSSGVTSVTAGFGLSGNVTTGDVTIINTSPDQTVTITGGTDIEITGSYPDFGINFTGNTSGDYLPLSGGTVTGETIFQSGLTANTIYSSGQVGIGTSNPNVAAIIEIASTSQGVLFPRMTIAQRNAISSPPVGLILFVTDGDNEGLYIYKSTGWVQII